MKRLLLALALGLSSPALAQQSVFIPATQQSTIVAGTVATTLIITGVAGKSTYITGLYQAPLATSTVQWISGTGATCGTGTVNLTGSMVFTTGNQAIAIGDGSGTFMVAGPGLSVCVIIGTAAAPGWVSWAQF
jgi:hypothetical protein